jgi:hypothetical protein
MLQSRADRAEYLGPIEPLYRESRRSLASPGRDSELGLVGVSVLGSDLTGWRSPESPVLSPKS